MSIEVTAGGLPIDAFNALCAREFAGISQARMADLLTQQTGQPWSQHMVRHMEKGKKQITVHTARAVCRVTGYPERWFFSPMSADPIAA